MDDEQVVWELHVELSSAAGSDSFYAPSAEAVEGIGEYTLNREGELAFDLILAIATEGLPDELRVRAYAVGRRLCPDESERAVRAYVDGWLRWSPGSSDPQPSWI